MLAGASEWTYGRHAELLTGVPNPPELDPTVTCTTTRNRALSSGAQFSRTPTWRAGEALCGPDPVRWALWGHAPHVP